MNFLEVWSNEEKKEKHGNWKKFERKGDDKNGKVEQDIEKDKDRSDFKGNQCGKKYQYSEESEEDEGGIYTPPRSHEQYNEENEEEQHDKNYKYLEDEDEEENDEQDDIKHDKVQYTDEYQYNSAEGKEDDEKYEHNTESEEKQDDKEYQHGEEDEEEQESKVCQYGDEKEKDKKHDISVKNCGQELDIGGLSLFWVGNKFIELDSPKNYRHEGYVVGNELSIYCPPDCGFFQREFNANLVMYQCQEDSDY